MSDVFLVAEVGFVGVLVGFAFGGMVAANPPPVGHTVPRSP